VSVLGMKDTREMLRPLNVASPYEAVDGVVRGRGGQQIVAELRCEEVERKRVCRVRRTNKKKL
jgi:hypothetical protein